MVMLLELRRRARHFIGPALGALIVGYFLIHSFYGDRGILAWMQLRQQVARAEAVAAESALLREQLAARINLLRSDRLDRDILDQQARIMAGLAHPDDIVVILPREWQDR